MPVTELRVEGYRSIRDLSLSLKRANIIVGPNGCGKSNLYNSMALLKAAAEGRLSRTVADEGGMASVLWAGGRKDGPVRMKLGITLDEYTYDLELGLPQNALSMFLLDPNVKEERLCLGKAGIMEQALMEAETGRALAHAWVVQLLVGPDGKVTDWPDWYWPMIEAVEGRPIPTVMDPVRIPWGPPPP